MWYLLAPLLLSAITIFILHRVSNHMTWGKAFAFAAGGLVISALILSGAFYAGKGAKTHDTEIWNGQVTSKARVHGTYTRSYSCNCRTTTSGSGKNSSTTTTCDTCYEDHWTVHWGCNSNIGPFTIDDKDWTSPAVYALPDPQRYTRIQPGDPVSKTHGYTNYIKAVPETLFKPAQGDLKARFKGMVPEYPMEIYDIYHVNRVIPVGVSIPSLQEWNDKLSDALKTLGPAKQANAVIVIVKTNDPSYFYALQDAWLNGKKNDIVLVIGAPDFPNKAAWVNVMALSQDDIFQVKLRDDILALPQLTPDAVISTLKSEAMATFKRKHMRDFAYLDAEIDPPAWVMELALAFIVMAYGGFWFFAFKQGNDL
jgi:hypothetical protein